ncbi:MAG: hypothetical protein NTY53_14785 [Kiritimatiellaeota bacterium]|nr:hypothetical protein [Kiritimatiellota bacterium]
MCRHLARGWPIIYVPTAGIYRSQRRTIRAFCRQLFTYGRGRAEQTRINPRSFSPMAIAASGFVFYWLLLWPLAWWLGPVVALLPATAYAGLNLLFSLAGSLRARRWLLLPVLPVLFFINHFLYGAGFLYGLLRPRRQPSAPASADAGWTLEKIKAFGG